MGLGTGRILGQNQSVLTDRAMELAVPDRVRDVDPGSKYSDRVAAFLDRGPVGGGIDPSGHPADNRHTGPDEAPGQAARSALPVPG